MSAMASSSRFFLSPPTAVSQNHRSSITVQASRFGSETPSLRQRGQRRIGRTAAKSTGAAKYKGTKMREEKLTEMIEKKVKEAKEVCEADERSEECKVAWDEVEEVSQAKADLRLRLQNQDPLESYCQENPETDECRIYED